MKSFLNAAEANDYMILFYSSCVMEKVYEGWNKRENITKEESTALKYATTYIKKFFKTLNGRLEKKELDKLSKRLSKFEYRLIDEHMMKKINRDATDKIKNTVMPRDQFETWCEEIMDIKCTRCTKIWTECELHDVFENNIAPEPTGYENSNCRYALCTYPKEKLEKAV